MNKNLEVLANIAPQDHWGADDITSIIHRAYDEIAEIAASVGIDWSQHCNTQFPFETSSSETQALEKSHKGRCGILAYVNRCSRTNREFPFIVFRTQKSGGVSAKFNGYKYLSKQAKQSQAEIEKARKTAEIARIAREELKAQKEAETIALNQSYREKIIAFSESSFTQCTDSKYLARKNLSEFSHLFKMGKKYNPETGKTYGKTCIAAPLFNENIDHVGYEYIEDESGAKSSSKGSGGGLRFAFVQSNDDSKDTAYVSEGIADMLTIHKVTNADCFASISASQIKRLVKHLLEELHYSHVVVCADNDQNNVGLNAAKFDVESGFYSVCLPSIHKDFSDVYVNQGAQAVKDQLERTVWARGAITEHSQYFTQAPIVDAVNIMLGEKGTGKTTIIQKMLENLDLSVLVISPRRALSRQISQDYGLTNYEDVKELEDCKALGRKYRLVCSPESLQFIDATQHRDIVIFDESEQGMDHSTSSSTMRGLNRANTSRLMAICQNAGTVVLSDANAAGGTIEFANIITSQSNKPVVTIRNTYKPRLERGDTVTIYKKEQTVLELFYRDVVSGIPCVFIANSRATAEKAHAMIEAANKHSILISSKTTRQHADVLKNVDEAINDYHAVSYTPAFGTGFSIKEGHKFKKAYVSFDGGFITAESCSQMLARFRGLGEYHAWIGEYKSPVSTSAKDLTQELIINPFNATLQNLDLAAMEVDLNGNAIIDNFSRLYLACLAEKNKSKCDFRSRMIEVMSDEGFSIFESDDDEKLNEEAKQVFEDEKNRIADEKIEQREKKALELVEQFELEIDCANELIEADAHRSIFSRGYKHHKIMMMTAKEARSDDTHDLKEIDSGKKAMIEANHTAQKRKTLKRIHKLLGTCGKTLDITDRKMFSNKSKRLQAEIKNIYDDVHSYFRVSLNRSDSVKAVGQLAKLIGLTIESASERGVYAISQRSIDVMHHAINLCDSVGVSDIVDAFKQSKEFQFM